METKKPIALLLLLGGMAGALVSFTDVYDAVKGRLFPQNRNLQGLHLCLYDQCVKDNKKFVSTVANSIGRSVDADFILDIPIGIGDFNARCISSLPYLYGPEGIYFIPSDLIECDVRNGIIFEIPTEYQLPVDGTSFSQQVRIKGTYNVSVAGPEPVFKLTKE